MAIAALVISIVAVVVAILSVVFTARADRRAGRGERRELEAALEVTYQGGGSTAEGPTEHVFQVLNTGKVPALGVGAWLVDARTRDQLHEDAPGPGITLLPHSGTEIRISTRADLADALLSLHWRDGAGQHIEMLDGHGRRLSQERRDIRDLGT
jgi:hypothetical protein